MRLSLLDESRLRAVTGLLITAAVRRGFSEPGDWLRARKTVMAANLSEVELPNHYVIAIPHHQCVLTQLSLNANFL